MGVSTIALKARGGNPQLIRDPSALRQPPPLVTAPRRRHPQEAHHEVLADAGDQAEGARRHPRLRRSDLQGGPPGGRWGTPTPGGTPTGLLGCISCIMESAMASRRRGRGDRNPPPTCKGGRLLHIPPPSCPSGPRGQEYADKEGIKIFSANIIYHLFAGARVRVTGCGGWPRGWGPDLGRRTAKRHAPNPPRKSAPPSGTLAVGWPRQPEVPPM